MAKLEEIKAQAEIEEQNKALAQRILSEGDKKNLDLLEKFVLLTTDTVFQQC